MINLKKNSTIQSVFVLFITFLMLTSCGSEKLYNSEIKGKQIPVSDTYKNDAQIEDFVAPYRDHINKDLDSVLAYAPETFTKTKGKWQTNIGNLMADMTFEAADSLLYKREKEHVDICLLNYGGIRATIPQGNVTARSAYEIMPFENSLIVMALRGKQINEIAEYISQGKRPHPLAGMLIIMDSNRTVKNATVQGKPIDENKVYYVATSDYLSNGGDNMNFFKEAVAQYKLDYKLRNIYIDYFRKIDTLPVNNSNRIITE